MKEGSQETWKTAYLLLIGLSLIPFGFHLLFRKKSIHYEGKKLTINAARFEAQNLRLPSFSVFFPKVHSWNYIQLKLFFYVPFRIIFESFHFNIYCFTFQLLAAHEKLIKKIPQRKLDFLKAPCIFVHVRYPKFGLLMTHTIWI